MRGSSLTGTAHKGGDPYQVLHSSCVVVLDRIDPVKMEGIFPSNIRGRPGSDFENLEVHCNKGEEHIGANQIFPIITSGETTATPTVKHHCPMTDLSASLRACSNKVAPHPVVFENYRKWFRREFIPKFLDCLDNEVWIVDFDKWLENPRYPVQYRNKLRKAFQPENRRFEHPTYEAFAKVELQFTTVSHYSKETPLNTVKERQICGPTDEKKCKANAFINILEEVAHKYFKNYCGRKNWLEICDDLEKEEHRLPGMTYAAADGSGFDMTQLKHSNLLMNELIIRAAKHPNVVFNEPLTIEDVVSALDESVVLVVSVDNGNLKYNADGRASGDGWTTFGNTMLMISYWMYTYYMAGYSEDEYMLRCKGDDTLQGFLPGPKVDTLRKSIDVNFTTRKDKHVHGLGQICTKIKYGPIEEMDFLSCHFFRTNNGKLRMCRMLPRVLQTNAWTTAKLDSRSDKTNQQMTDAMAKWGVKLVGGLKTHYKVEFARRQLLRAKAMSGLAWARGLPIYEKLYTKMYELGTDGPISNLKEYSDYGRVWHAVDDRDSFLGYLSTMYNLNQDDVADIEHAISLVTNLTGELDIPILSKVALAYLEDV